MALSLACPLRCRLPLCMSENCGALATMTICLEEAYGFDAFDSSAADCLRTGRYRFSHSVALDQAVFKRLSAAPDETACHFLTRGG